MAAQYIDFKAIKERVTLLKAMQMVGIELRLRGNQYRGPCPTCQRGDDRSLVITPDKGFYCHAAEKGGDVIAFVAHVRDTGQREAAQELAEHFGIAMKPETARKETPAQPRTTPRAAKEPLQPLDYLEPDHEALELLGLSRGACETLGIGYAPKGTMIGRILIPLRLKDGTLVGYFGIATKVDQSPLLKFPGNLDEMVAVSGTVEEQLKVTPQHELRKLLRVV